MHFSINDLRSIIREATGDAYRVLGLTPRATDDEIKKAFRSKAISLHPDKNPGVDTAKEMVRVNVAYDLLKDPDKRKKYDMFGDKTMDKYTDAAAKPSQPNQPQPSSSYNTSGSGPETYDQWRARQERDARNNAYEKDRQPKQKQSQDDGYTKVYLEFKKGTSKKFWAAQIVGKQVVVRYGRIGSTGQVKIQDAISPKRFIQNKIWAKMDKGYVRANPPAGFWESREQEYSKKSPGPARPNKSNSSPSQKKDTYKIYRGKYPNPSVTRYKGKVYKSQTGTKFYAGDQARVELDPKGHLNVTDPQTGHTQKWYSENVIRDEIVESVMKSLTKFVI